MDNQINKNFDLQLIDGQKDGEVKAYLTTFENLDKVNDVIKTGALDDYVEKFNNGETDVLRMLWMHDRSTIIGKWVSLEIDDKGVIGTGIIFEEVTQGKDVKALLKRGVLNSVSIGFRSINYEINELNGKDFYEIELTETSIVDNPANPMADIISVKAEDGQVNVRSLEKALRDVGLSRKESKHLASLANKELNDSVRDEQNAQEPVVADADETSSNKSKEDNMSDTQNPAVEEVIEEVVAEEVEAKTEEVIETPVEETPVEVEAEEKALDLVKADLEAATEAATVVAEKHAAELTATVEKHAAELAEAKAEAQSEIDALEAKFDALPTITSEIKEETKMEFTQNELNAAKFELSLDITKAYGDNTDVTGGRVDSNAIRHDLAQGNILRNHAHILNTTSGSVKLPTLSAGSFAEEGTVNTSRTQGGAIASKTVVVKNFVGSNQISKPALEDITSFDATMISLMTQEAGVVEGADAVAALKAEAGYGSVTKSADIMTDLSAMVASLGSAYKTNAKFFMSREAMDEVRLADKSGLVFDATVGSFTIFGHQVVIVDGIDSGATATDKSIYFGNMDRALVIVSRKSLELTRMMETAPGYVTYFGDLRSVAASWDVNALVALETA